MADWIVVTSVWTEEDVFVNTTHITMVQEDNSGENVTEIYIRDTPRPLEVMEPLKEVMEMIVYEEPHEEEEQPTKEQKYLG